MSDQKLRVVTSFEKVSDELQEQIKLEYPYGFSDHLIKFPGKDGERISALRFETDEKIYLIKMTKAVAEQIIEDDEDYDNEGNLKDDAREEYEDKHSDSDSDYENGDEDQDFD